MSGSNPQASRTLGVKAGPGGGHSGGLPANPIFGDLCWKQLPLPNRGLGTGRSPGALRAPFVPNL